MVVCPYQGLLMSRSLSLVKAQILWCATA